MFLKRFWFWLSSPETRPAFSAAHTARRNSRCTSARDGRRTPAAARRSRGKECWSCPSDTRHGAVAVLRLRRRFQDRRIEMRDAPWRYRPARRTPRKECRARCARSARRPAHSSARGCPTDNRLDVVVVLAETELCAVEFRPHHVETVEQRLAARDNHSGVAAHHLRLPLGR